MYVVSNVRFISKYVYISIVWTRKVVISINFRRFMGLIGLMGLRYFIERRKYSLGMFIIKKKKQEEKSGFGLE